MMNLPENFVTYDEARKAGFIKMKELKRKRRQNGRHILLLCPGGNFDGGRRSERFSVRFQRAADPCG